VNINGGLWRPVQDCSSGYGAALGLAEVIELSPTTFRQVVRHAIKPGPLWPGRKLHTLNRCGELEVIDGARIQPKLKALKSRPVSAVWSKSISPAQAKTDGIVFDQAAIAGDLLPQRKRDQPARH
jgi:hypothetical protein